MPESQFLADVKATNIARLVSHLSGVGQSIVEAYPMAEVQSWTIQRAEAEAILAAGNNATLAMAPFLQMVCEAHYGRDADPAMRLQRIKEKAVEVKANADLWARLAAYVNGLRARTQDAIDAATTERAAHLALHEAFTELEQWRAAAGI